MADGTDSEWEEPSSRAKAPGHVVWQRRPRAQQASFTQNDDERLRAILERRRLPLRYGEWGQVANELGKFTGEQVREHFRSLRRRAEVAEITVQEGREIVREEVAQASRFREVARGITTGRCRSPDVVRMALTEIYDKLKRLGFKVRTPDDADLLPDELLKSGAVPPARAAELLREYNEARARRALELGQSPDAD
jgi:hypothetical protein